MSPVRALRIVISVLLIQGVITMQPAQSAEADPRVVELLQALRREYLDIRLGQLNPPFSNLPLKVDGWAVNWLDIIESSAHRAMRPRLVVPGNGGNLEIRLTGLGYTTKKDGALASYSLHAENVQRVVCIRLDEVKAAFPEGSYSVDYAVPHHGQPIPEEHRIYVRWIVVSSRDNDAYFAFRFNYEDAQKVVPHCVSKISFTANVKAASK